MSPLRLLTCAVLGLAVVACYALPLQAANSFAPHRALYSLSLSQSRASSHIVQARGKLEFKWDDICSGWTIAQRTRVQLVSTEGLVVDFGWTFDAFESKDGRDYRFVIRRFNGDGSNEEISGTARLGGPGKGGTATFEKPEPRQLELPAGTLFPTAHSLLLIEAAQDGALPLWKVVFDGSGDTALFGVNAALSQALPATAPSAFSSPLLAGKPSWRIDLAFFAMDAGQALPEQEQVLRLYPQGYADEMIFDYGDFALDARLTDLDPLTDQGC